MRLEVYSLLYIVAIFFVVISAMFSFSYDINGVGIKSIISSDIFSLVFYVLIFLMFLLLSLGALTVINAVRKNEEKI